MKDKEAREKIESLERQVESLRAEVRRVVGTGYFKAAAFGSPFAPTLDERLNKLADVVGLVHGADVWHDDSEPLPEVTRRLDALVRHLKLRVVRLPETIGFVKRKKGE